MARTAMILAVSVLLLPCIASAGLSPGDRMLVDVGVCWDGGTGYPGYGPINAGSYWDPDPNAHGPGVSAASDGNFWNNYSTQDGGPFQMITTAGAMSTVTVTIPNWSGCEAGGQVYEIDPASSLYPEKAQTDCRWFAVGKQPGQVTLSGLDTALTYNVRVLSYVSADANMSDIDPPPDAPFPAGTVDLTIGMTTLTVNPVDNASTTNFMGVSPDASGQLVIELAANSPDDCGVPLNVIDITVVPEPLTMGLLALGGLALLRRRRN